MKYAYLIIANKNPKQLQMLIDMLDDSRNDIYLLIDNKSYIKNYKFNVNYSNIDYLKPINIYWGGYSQIHAEINLFKASCHEHYAYYHLLSGLDLPLVNQDVIHDFFDRHPHKEFIKYNDTQSPQKLSERIKHHFFRRHFHGHKILRKMEALLLRSFKEPIPLDKIQCGSNWVSIGDKLVHLIVHHEKDFYEIYKYGLCVDELFIPILLNYYPWLKSKVYYKKPFYGSPNDFQGNMRYIDWWDQYNKSSPHIWTLKDYNTLVKARKRGYLFSRKFDTSIDYKIVYKMFSLVMCNSNKILKK